jgi:protein-disulfide isomerase-like protein with CxxC motif
MIDGLLSFTIGLAPVLTAESLLEPTQKFEALKAIQHPRYVDGKICPLATSLEPSLGFKDAAC